MSSFTASGLEPCQMAGTGRRSSPTAANTSPVLRACRCLRAFRSIRARMTWRHGWTACWPTTMMSAGDGRPTTASTRPSLPTCSELPLGATARMGELSERIPEAFVSALDTLPAKAAASTRACDLLGEIEKRALAGIEISRHLAKASRRTPSESRDLSLGRLPARPDPGRKAVCGYRGPRSKKLCVLTRGHRGQHRYTAG